MQTILRSQSQEVIISPDRPFVIIGERINPTGRKKLAEALEQGDYAYVLDLARMQIEAGADMLDVNVGVPGLDETHVLPEVVKLLASEFDLPLCLDSANPEALAASLEVAPGKPLVNSVNGEESSLKSVLPVVKARGAAVIGLTMGDRGIPHDPESRLAIAESILERAAKAGIPAEDVIIDPLVLSVGAESQAAAVTLRAIEALRDTFGVNINLGASNVSFGLPDRHTINQSFLALAIGAGATCAITDPAKLTPTIRAIDLLLGRDNYASRYLTHYRQRSADKGTG
ncbi:MAG: dihydropteroate synthase [Anaerolineales bacterium]|jgi:5-methyltetrahydrofolate--homocysteine methyltransferase